MKLKKTSKTSIGASEVRIGKLGKGGQMEEPHSVGIVEGVTMEITEEVGLFAWLRWKISQIPEYLRLLRVRWILWTIARKERKWERDHS